MNILAIDPGPTESAFVVIGHNPEFSIVERGKVSNERMLVIITSHAGSASKLVVEQVASFGMAVGESVFETVFWSGRFCQAWGNPFHRIKRHEVKMHICRNMRAKDSNIRQAMIDRFGPPGTKKNKGVTYGISGDMWSALAVGVTFLDTRAHQP